MSNEQENPLVSVVIPTYKRPDMLGRAINSVLNQTYDNIEIIVVDDNDADSEYRRETEEFLERYADVDNLLYLKHKKNKNGAAARNTGINNAKGEYIAFLDDDDEWLSEKIEFQVEAIENLEVTAVYCNHFVRNNNQLYTVTAEIKGNIYKNLLKGNCTSMTSSILIKKSELLKVNGFDERLASFQDYDLWLRLFKDNKIDFIDETLVIVDRELSEYRVSHNLEGRLGALKVIISKWEKEINKYSNTKEFKNKYKKMAFLSNAKMVMKNGDRLASIKLYLKALRIHPLDIKIYAYILLALLGEKVYSLIEGVHKKLKRKSNNSEVGK
jgi:glycosyltransferase involved in cell wall biosynthesis